MQALPLKMLFLKKGTASAILAIALLIALLTSVSCLVNNINAQTTALGQLASVGETYILTSKESSSLSDSQIHLNLISQVKNFSNVKYATSHWLIQADVAFHNSTFPITARGVDDTKAYLTKNSAYINGSACKTTAEVDVGVILANLMGLNKNDNITLIINGASTQLKVVGITRTQTQSDSQLIIPLTTMQELTGQKDTTSYIEFAVKDLSKSTETNQNLTLAIQSKIKIISTQQTTTFAGDINNQTVNFINIWSISIYAVVVAASYITAARLINEAHDDLSIFRTIGATKRRTFGLILAFVLIITVFGAAIGVSLGVFGTQFIATEVRWNLGNTQLAPFLEVNQALQIFSLSLVSSLAGAFYPSLQGSRILSKENQA